MKGNPGPSGPAQRKLMNLSGKCYSGHKADQRPARFPLAELDYFVEELPDQWYRPEDTYFKVGRVMAGRKITGTSNRSGQR